LRSLDHEPSISTDYGYVSQIRLLYSCVDVFPEPLLTMREAARRFGVPRFLLYRAAEKGELPRYDLGAWPRVYAVDVRNWLERQRRVPGEDV
jgi:excisionase family DNA binding protein